jgi:hypothetical protein
VEKFFGEKRTVRSIDLQLLEEYQEERRKQISPTMKKVVNAHGELQDASLTWVMRYARCWKREFTEGYQSLWQKRSRVRRVATEDQWMKIIATAKNNE